MTFPFLHRTLTVLTLAASLTLGSAVLHAQSAANQPIALSEYSVTPNPAYVSSTIAVAPFDVSKAALDMETLSRIIRKNLEYSGFFNMPKDKSAVVRQNNADHSTKKINFNAWKNMGVDHYLMGRVEETGNQMKVTLLLYDINGGQLILSRSIEGRKEAFRHLAHRASDLVINFITGVDGMCTTKVLFATEQVPGEREIAIMDWDGFNIRPITNLDSISTYPAWGANGTEFYFMSYVGNRANLYGMLLNYDEALNVSGGQRWTIAAYGGTNHSPAWSQSSRRLAMVLSKDGNSEIYTSSRDGKDLRRLTKTKATEGSPTWSPDGKRVAFTSNEQGGVHLYIMNADGSNKTRVTKQGTWCDAASWSPDGTRLAFSYRERGNSDIYTCDVRGNNFSYRRLTQGQGNNESPTWAPNGVHLAFSSDRTGSKQVYIMLDDGTKQRQITNVGRNLLPDWGPIPPVR